MATGSRPTAASPHSLGRQRRTPELSEGKPRWHLCEKRSSLRPALTTCGRPFTTFGNGIVVREPIVTIDDQAKRLVWSAEGGLTKHFNAAVQVFSIEGGSTRVVWVADFLPDTASERIAGAMDAGMAVMKKTLDRLAYEGS
jgi:hypothetical protein